MAGEGKASFLRPPYPYPRPGQGASRGSGFELGFVHRAPDKPPARREAGGGRPRLPPSPTPPTPGCGAAAAEALALSGCWADAEAGIRPREVQKEPQPFLVGGLPLFPPHCPGRGREPGWGRVL